MARSKSPTPQLYVFAAATATLRVPGTVWRFPVEEGKAYWADHPAVLAHPAAFTADPPRIFPTDWTPAVESVPVEQATAAPGEQRESGRGV